MFSDFIPGTIRSGYVCRIIEQINLEAFTVSIPLKAVSAYHPRMMLADFLSMHLRNIYSEPVA